MGTVVSGNSGEIYYPLEQSVTFTPAASALLSFSNPASETPDSRVIWAPTIVTVASGTTAFIEARGGSVTYTEPETSRDGMVFLEGADGSDVTTAFLAACVEANTAGVPLILPPWNITISRTATIDKMVGTPGKSKITLASAFTKSGFANQFAFLNAGFSQSYNAATASEILYRDFEVECTPGVNLAFFGLANVKGGLVENVSLRFNKAINSGTGKPYIADSLLDLYACVKNLKVRRCKFFQLSEAYGTHRFAAGGGGCVWIRNLRSTGGTAADNVTEGNEVSECYFYHTTSDEALAIYGVRGPSRNNTAHHNVLVSPLPATSGVYHVVLLSIFPLDDGSGAGLGDTAAVYDNAMHDNVIDDRAFMYNVLKIGNSGDASRLCYGNVSRGNKITAFRSSNATYGPKAVRDADSSGSADPDVASKVIRCIEGTVAVAYAGGLSGNRSENDQVFVVSGGSQVNAAFNGWQTVTNPTSRGDVFSAVDTCTTVQGGTLEAFGRVYYNTNHAAGGFVRVNGSGSSAYCVFYVDTTASEAYSMNSVRFISGGGFVNLTSAVVATSRFSFVGNIGSMGNASAAAIINNANGSAIVKAHANLVTGSMSGPTSGTGTTTRTDNNWAGTTD